MLEYQHDFDSAIGLGERAFKLLQELETPAIPPNYELFYVFASGSNRQLNDAVKKLLAENKQITADDARELCETFLGDDDLDIHIEEVGDQLSHEITDILQHLDSATHCTQAFGDSLSKVNEQLGTISDPKQAQTVVEKIIEASKRMTENTSQLEKRLDDSRQQISDLQDNLEAVRAESMTDSLTGVANRKLFDRTLSDAIEQARESGEPLSLLMMDIDHFKRFNDTFGHQAGDGVLRLVAAAMKANVKGRDLVARYGGEEFSAVLPATALANALTVAEQVRQAVMTKELIKKSSGESLGNVTLSIGAATLEDGEDAEQLISRADRYLYSAKRGGRNRVMAEDDQDHAEVEESGDVVIEAISAA